MKEQDYHTSITVEATASEAFNCINSVTKWWTENLEGRSQKLNDEFTVRFGDVHYSQQKLIEVVVDKKLCGSLPTANLTLSKTNRNGTIPKLVLIFLPTITKLESILPT
jgi:hypothetical protein